MMIYQYNARRNYKPAKLVINFFFFCMIFFLVKCTTVDNHQPDVNQPFCNNLYHQSDECCNLRHFISLCPYL